jgi:hypothetical protein
LNLIDEYTPESLLIRAERRWTSAKVIKALADFSRMRPAVSGVTWSIFHAARTIV